MANTGKQVDGDVIEKLPPLPEAGGYRDVDGDWVSRGHTDASMIAYAVEAVKSATASRDRRIAALEPMFNKCVEQSFQIEDLQRGMTPKGWKLVPIEPTDGEPKP